MKNSIRNYGMHSTHNVLRRSSLYLNVALLLFASMVPLVSFQATSAAQLTSRSVTISSSAPAATGVTYGFKFSWSEATAVRGVILQFCTTALGTCTLPTGMNVSGATVNGSTGFPGGALSTSKTTASTGDCTAASGGTATMICLSSASTTSGAGADATISLGAITNPNLATPPNATTVYVRVSLYATAGYTGVVHSGTVAAAITRQLNVSGRVQERLLLCVAAIDDGGSTDTTLPTNLPACGAITDTTIDLGVIDNTSVARSPVDNSPPSSQGNDKYGIAMVNTNAASGVAITYFAEADTTSGATEQLRAFRVPGATCNAAANNVSDQCFQSAATSGSTIAAGTELFGLTVPCIIAYNSSGNVNNVATTTRNLFMNGSALAYSGTDNDVSPTADCENTDTGTKYAWNPNDTATELAKSNSVVDNEIIKLRFAATAAATTPTGAYTVRSTYIATPTF